MYLFLFQEKLNTLIEPEKRKFVKGNIRKTKKFKELFNPAGAIPQSAALRQPAPFRKGSQEGADRD